MNLEDMLDWNVLKFKDKTLWKWRPIFLREFRRHLRLKYCENGRQYYQDGSGKCYDQIPSKLLAQEEDIDAKHFHFDSDMNKKIKKTKI